DPPPGGSRRVGVPRLGCDQQSRSVVRVRGGRGGGTGCAFGWAEGGVLPMGWCLEVSAPRGRGRTLGMGAGRFQPVWGFPAGGPSIIVPLFAKRSCSRPCPGC